MEVYLRKDVEKVGLAGEIIKVGDGFARNFLIPKGLAVEITSKNKGDFLAKIRTFENRKEILASQEAMLAEKINSSTITIKKKMHDNGQLYGSISSAEIVEGLARQGITINKNQVELAKPIKEKGSFKVTIKLTTRLQPAVTVTITAE
jgi:large subunit ribosomal protein L9